MSNKKLFGICPLVYLGLTPFLGQILDYPVIFFIVICVFKFLPILKGILQYIVFQENCPFQFPFQLYVHLYQIKCFLIIKKISNYFHFLLLILYIIFIPSPLHTHFSDLLNNILFYLSFPRKALGWLYCLPVCSIYLISIFFYFFFIF